MAQQSAGMPYIGSLISLISKTGVRYEGTLYTIDMVESTIALQNVHSFGTEGRKQDGPQIPASDRPFEFIIFRGTDIADLTVITNGPPEGQQEPSAPPAAYSDQQAPHAHAPPSQPGRSADVPHYTPQLPAQSDTQSHAPSAPHQPPPASHPRQPQQQYHTPQPPQPTPAPTVSLTSQGSGQGRGQPRSNQAGQGPSAPSQGDPSSAPQPTPSAATQAAQAAAKQAARPSSFLQAAGGSTAPDNNRGPAGTPQPGRGGGGAGAPGGGRGRGRAPPRAPPVTVPNEDFDFEEMMKKFNKQSQLKEGEAQPQQPKAPEKPAFEDDFFDSISSDATERLAREDGRGRFAEQRKIDMETFGGAGMARRHQGGRGGHRGGRSGQQQGQGHGQNYQNGPARGQGYQNGPARGQSQGYQNRPGRGGRGQGYQNAVSREDSQGASQGGRGNGGFQTVPSRGAYRGGGRGGSAPRGRGRGRNAAPMAAQS
ncbi:hypothetical protein ABBQ32_007657 [Trebouxia sp. C0010 RCD-2024]